jgi:hypothetical protein
MMIYFYFVFTDTVTVILTDAKTNQSVGEEMEVMITVSITTTLGVN